jgi:ornithine cyclodeaminase
MADQKVEFHYLNQPEMIKAGVMNMTDCVDVMEKTFSIMGRGDYILGGPSHNHHGMMIQFPKDPKGPKMPVEGPDRRFMACVSYLGGDYHLCGTKWYGSNSDNLKKNLPRSIHLIIINDPETGVPIAMMEGNLISAMRTGAVVGLGARYLASPEGQTAGIIAAGPISRTCLMALAVGLPQLKEARVYDLDYKKALLFSKEMSQELDIDVHPVANIQDAVRDCDAVSTAASGKTIPKFDKKWFKDGAYIALSSNADLPDELWLNSTLVADNWKMHIDWREEINSKNHSKIPIHGKLHGLIKSRKISDEDISEMGDIVTKKKSVIRGDGSVNIFLTGGMGIEDISWAYEIYKKAIKKSLGKSLKLWDAPYLY